MNMIKKNKGKLWLENEKHTDRFDISKIKKFKKELEKIFIKLSKRRILKYRFYRIYMWFLRLSIIGIIPYIIQIINIK